MKLTKIIAENVRGFREAQGFTRAEFAKRAGFHLNYLGAVERGEKNITVETLERVGSVLGIDPQILLISGASKWGKRKFN
jgi:transcriptional regulator with XRE-family HTH domain